MGMFESYHPAVLYGPLNAPCGKKPDDKYSMEDILKLTKNICRVNHGDDRGYKIAAIRKETRGLLDTIEIN